MRTLAYFDEQTVGFVNSIRKPLLNKFFIFISYFGAGDVIFFIAAAVSIFLILRIGKENILKLWIALIGAILSMSVLKLVIQRPRPLDGITEEPSFSFPSAHAVLSAAFYGFILYLILRSDSSRAVKFIFSVGLSFLIILIGFSRLYLGVHYLSDVIGGYILGGLWLFVGIKLGKLKNSK